MAEHGHDAVIDSLVDSAEYLKSLATTSFLTPAPEFPG